MNEPRGIRTELRNMLHYGDLSFRDFMEVALYHPEFGYYTTGAARVGRGGDYVTAPLLSPVFSFALGSLCREFVRRAGGAVCSIVDIGCGDGSLIRQIAREAGEEGPTFYGIDRSLSRVPEPEAGPVRFLHSLEEVPRGGCHLILSNELYDAFPFSRLVNRADGLHELWVAERDGTLDWTEHEAAPAYSDYLRSHGVTLADGQFADISLEWEAFHAEVIRWLDRGLIVTFDYGYPADRLFHPRARRFGTAAAYTGQKVSRDLLASPGEQDLTAHINFSDLERAGAREGARTLLFSRLARFLLSLGAAEHPIFRPAEEAGFQTPDEGLRWLEAREDARRLVLPDGIGDEMRVLVQEKGFGGGEWSFQDVAGRR